MATVSVMRSYEEQSGLARLGATIRIRREALGLSQADVGADAGLHRTYISGIERGERNPSIISLARIAGALQTTPDYLLKEWFDTGQAQGQGVNRCS